MLDAERIPLPPGLPAHLSVGKEGYDGLCALLDVTTRDRRQALANAPFVKQLLKATGSAPTRHVKTAERTRQSLLALYGDPITRRRFWRNVRQQASVGNAGGTPLPSLEHAALSRYDAALLTAEPDPERLANSDAFYVSELGSDDWRAPALAALPRLRDDFADWSSAPPARRTEIIAAAFAAATLLDDARLLRWAADREDDIAREYAFLDKAPAASGADEDTSAAGDAGGDLPARLRDRSSALRDAAIHLTEGPATHALFDALTQHYSEVLELREPVLALADADAVGDLIAGFATLLAQKASTAPWLTEEIEPLLAAWREAFLPGASTVPEQLRADIERAVATSAATLAKAGTAQADADEAEAALDRHEAALASKAAPSRADRQQQTTLSQELATVRQTVVDAMDEVLAALRPNPGGAALTPGPTAKGPDTAAPHDTAPRTAPETTPEDAADTQITPPTTVDLPAVATSEPPPPEPPPQPLQTEREAETPGDPPMPSQDAVAPVGAPKPAAETPPPEKASPVPEDVPSAVTASLEDPLPGGVGPQPITAAVALPPAQAAIWRAVGSGRPGLAYHIARLDQAVGGHTLQPSPELLAAVALGTALRGPHDDLAAAFGRRVGVLGGLDFDGVERPTRDALNLLLFVATLRPALFASQRGASIPLLRRVELSGSLTSVYRLAATVADHAEKLQTVHLDVPTLTAILDEGVWKDRIAAHAEAVAHWREGATAATLLFAGAGAVWQHWLGARGILGELARLLVADRAADAPRVQRITDLLDDRKAVHTLIEDTDRHAVGRHGESISGRALAQLESRLDAPRDLARAWLRIMEARPGGAGFVEKTVERLRSAVDERAPAALDAIARLRQAQLTAPLAGALACAAEAVESLTNLFRRGGDSGPEIGLGPIQALSDDLLFVTALRIDREGAIDDSLAPTDALALLIDAGSHADTLANAFDARLDLGDLSGAHAVCERMVAEDDAAADASRERLDHALAQSRASLQRRLYELTEQLEQASVIGEVSEDERTELTAAIGDAAQRLENRDHALNAGDAVAAIAAAVEPPFARGVAKVREQIDAYLPRDDAREQALVRDALQAGDLATLHEQLDCLKSDQPLLSPNAGVRSRLRSFLAVADRIDAELNGEAGPAQDALVSAAAHREDILGLPFSALSPTQAKRSSVLLESWFLMARQRSPDPELVARFFAGLGFTLTAGGVEPRGDAAAVLRAEPLRARELCPTHAFGSDADGRYDLVFNWNAPAREPIVQAVATADPNAHTIVLHFGKLAGVDRHWLRRWSIEHPTQFITVDETLVLYLASLPGGALRALFECTLPFTCSEPFFTAPGLVPPEAFFGRESERRDIMDRYGSCFVYGGRQLGKTALLHAVQAAFHDPGTRRLAGYVDLKYEDVGIAYGADHIWQVLWREFVKLDIVDAGTAMPRGRNSLVDAIAKAVTGWLAAHDDGRILLLLDEADAFLANDLRDDFRVSTRLKGLMDETGRRFKVVLCGLHNVLRNTERANHPLAHFGEPVCVGPLLGNGDLEQARALVREPMAAVGYAFETENLVTQILIWTNYYPSFIQLYGQALLRHLRQAPGRDFPHAVTADDIQAVFARDQFRDYIRNRFSLTLQLDQRYEVVTYAMAVDLQGASDGLVHGLSSNRIFDLAHEYWPSGFDIPKREFGTLLQEMCGLGVLRQRPGGPGPARYVFRNPNVLRLLGDADTILDVLYKERDIPDIFQESAFHAQYGRSKAGSPRRGPLTYEQETLLKRGGRIAVLCGTRAARLADVPTFLGERMEEGLLRRLKPTSDANALVGVLNRLRPDRDTYVCLVDDDEPWTLRWLDRASDALRKAQRGRKLRVVFCADPDQLWRFLKELPDEYLDADNDLFDWVAAQPWNAAFLRRWCSDQGLHDAGAKISDLLELTGGWPLLLEHYATSAGKTWEARAAELERYVGEHRDDLLDAVGLGDPAVRLELAPLRAWETLNASEVDTYADVWAEEGLPSIAADVLRRRLCWATQLGLVQDIDGSTVLNPLIARILPDDIP